MAFKVRCPACGNTMLAGSADVGHEMRCVSCGADFPVAGSNDTTPPRAFDREPSDEPRPEAEPRRRPRRPADCPTRPARSPGRSVFFWLAIAFGGLVLGGFACCGGGYALLPGEKWRKYDSPQGGYSVEIPVEPKPDMKIPGVKPDPDLKIEGGILVKRGECYVVMYAETLPREMRAANDQQLLNEAVRGMSSDPDVKRVVRDEPVTVSGFPGREIEAVTTDGGTNIARVVIADRRIYIVIGGGRFVRPGNANIRRFIDSFAVTDPNLKGGQAFQQKQKEEELRKEAERLAAEERARREAAHRQKENEAFLTAPHAGPKPGDPQALSLTSGDIIHFSLDEEAPPGLGEWKTTRPLLSRATHGPGTRGKAAFLTGATQSQNIQLYLKESPVRNLPLGLKGFTLSGWYKARHRPFDLFWISVPTNIDSQTKGAQVRVRVEERSVIAWSRGAGEALEVSAPRPSDDGWHHAAVVFDQAGRDAVVSVYIDGKKVAGGAGTRTHLAYSLIGVGYPRPDGPDWRPLTDSQGDPAATRPDDFIGAIDECCVIDGPLAEADVRKLAGLEPMGPRTLQQHGPKFETPFEVADAKLIDGLKTYYPFENPGHRESGVGFGPGSLRADVPELVLGPRGRAWRVTASPQFAGYGFLYRQEPKYTKLGIGVAEGVPFTLAFWVRMEADKPGPANLLKTQGSADKGYRNIFISRNSKTGDISFKITNDSTVLFSATRPGGRPGEWTHLALARNKDGHFRVSVNGDVKAVDGLIRSAIPINSFDIGEGFEAGWYKTTPPYILEFDEFCIFDRALSDDELAALAGRKAMPKK